MWSRNYVRAEHLPTGMTAISDRTISNFKNKADCLSVLRGKLWSLEHGTEPEAATDATDAQRAIADRILSKHT